MCFKLLELLVMRVLFCELTTKRSKDCAICRLIENNKRKFSTQYGYTKRQYILTKSITYSMYGDNLSLDHSRITAV